MPEQAYTAAVARLIEVDNAEVKKKAKKIAAARRRTDMAVEVMWDAIKSAESETSAESSRRIRVEVQSDSSESDEEETQEQARWVKVEVRGANMVENPILSVDLWRRLTSKHPKA